VLDQEKSKLSLAQVYEQEFLKVAEAKEKAPAPSLLHKDTEDTPKVSSSRWRRPRRRRPHPASYTRTQRTLPR
jgi:hypothetical protein